MDNFALSAIIFFGSGLSFLMAIEQVIFRKPVKVNYLMCALCVCDAFLLLGTGVVANEIYMDYPFAIFFFTTSIFLSGPFNLLLYYSLLNPIGALPYKIKIHIIPAIVVFIMEISIQFLPFEIKKQLIYELFTFPTTHFITPVIVIGTVHAFSYLIFLLKVEFSMWRVEEIKIGLRIIVLSTIMGIFAVIFLALGFFFSLDKLFLSGGVVISIIQMIIFLSNSKYVEFYKQFEREFRKKRYERSLLDGLDTETIQERLMELMTIEEIYKDFDLSINDVAQKLSINIHQFSQFLNDKMGMEFRNFINKYRVEEAKRLLEEDDSQNIINICFHVGFSSKSAFNSAFRKFTGTTPTEYRNKKFKSNNHVRKIS
jgi:AraC-like DNA-binding protein